MSLEGTLSLSLEGKITIYKSLAISIMVYVVLLRLIANNVTEELKQIQKTFFRGEIRELT